MINHHNLVPKAANAVHSQEKDKNGLKYFDNGFIFFLQFKLIDGFCKSCYSCDFQNFQEFDRVQAKRFVRDSRKKIENEEATEHVTFRYLFSISDHLPLRVIETSIELSDDVNKE